MVNGELRDLQPTLYTRLEWPCGAFGGPAYHWYKNGVLISDTSPDGKVVVERRNSRSYLIIKNVTDANNGMYQCTAGNELDTIYSTARLHVVEKKPVFTEKMGPVILIANRTGLVICPVAASPPPEITWRKNGRIILKVGKADVQNDKRFKAAANQRDLLIPSVKLSDAGTYTCHAKNRKGSAEDSSDITVGKDIVWIAAPVDNRNVTITLRFELDCEAEGDPSYEVSYRWLRNGLPLEYSARIHWVKEANRLVILDAIVSDTGTYTCIASAETPLYIERRKDVDIVVKAPANPPDLVWIDGSCWDQTASLAWRVGATNNEEIYEYWIDWSTTYDTTNWTRLPKVLEEDTKPVRLNFNLLPPFSQISFRVTVFNRIGAGEPSIPTDPSDCITKPAAPRFSPREIKGVPGGPNILKIEWTPVPETFWGGPAFNYSVQWRRKIASQQDENRWLFLPMSQDIRIFDGNNNSVTVTNPGYYVEWEFRIRSNNAKGSAPGWTYGTSHSGQDAPGVQPSGLSPDRVTARSADISWRRVTAPRNGTIFGYKIQYWHSGIGMQVAYQRNRNITIDLERIDELEQEREERGISKRSITKRDLRNKPRRIKERDTALTKSDFKTSIVSRYLTSVGRRLRKRDTREQNVPRIRKKREDEDENVEKEEPLDLCFNPDEPCYQDASDKELQLQELTPYKTYHVRIAAYNSGGLGPWSDELIFNTEAAPPGPPYSVNTYAYDKYCKLTWKEPRHKNGKILEYEVYGRQIVRTKLPWWMRRHIIYNLNLETVYEAKIRARTSSGWGIPVFRWFQTHDVEELPAKPLIPEVVGYGEDGVNVTFMEPIPESLRKFGGEMDEDPWELRPVGGFENEHVGVGGYPERFYVVYRRKYTNDKLKRTSEKLMWGPRDQTWIVIEKLQKDTVYQFATIPVNYVGKGPRSEWADGLTGGIV
ncbi:fibronectin type III domain-containing -like, partial [Paramuricea clavata]